MCRPTEVPKRVCLTLTFGPASPEGAPADVVLAQVLELSGLNDELVDLGDDLEVLVGLEVAARELLTDAVQHLDGARIL